MDLYGFYDYLHWLLWIKWSQDEKSLEGKYVISWINNLLLDIYFWLPLNAKILLIVHIVILPDGRKRKINSQMMLYNIYPKAIILDLFYRITLSSIALQFAFTTVINGKLFFNDFCITTS